MEDRYSGDRVDTDGSPDGTGYYLVSGEGAVLSHGGTRKDTEKVIITEEVIYTER